MAITLSRRGFVAGSLASAVLVPRASAQSLEKLRVNIIPINDVAPLMVAVHFGWFRELGLDVDRSPSAGGASGIPGLIGGSYDIVYGNVVSSITAASQGLDIKVIAVGTRAGMNEAEDVTQILVASDSGIKSGKDLEGKSLAVNTRNNVIWLYARAWVQRTGGDPDKVTYREIPFPQMEDAIRQKRVDAGFFVPPFSAAALSRSGMISIGKPYSAVQPGADVGQYITTGKLIAEKPETIKKFVAGLRRGIVWFNANRENEELLKIISGYTRIELPLLRQTSLPEMPQRVDLDQVNKTMDLMISHKMIASRIDLKKLVAAEAL